MANFREMVGARLRQARVHAGFSQESLAKRLGFSQEGYSGMERGRTLIGLDVLMEICEVLGRQVTYFVGVGVPGMDGVSDETREVMGLMESFVQREREAILWYARFLAQESAKEIYEQ